MDAWGAQLVDLTANQTRAVVEFFSRSEKPPLPSFYVYTHSRPDGRVFYVGKGSGRRAWDMAPSRRSSHHRNIVRKHGLQNIVITIVEAFSHEDAFQLECEMIAQHRAEGLVLVNLTDGGNGSAGHELNPAQEAALAKGRGKDRFASLSDDARRAILAGLARGRKKLPAYRASEDGRAHLKRLSAIGAKALEALRYERPVTCAECGVEFMARSEKARCCGRRCEQRNRRARQRNAGAIPICVSVPFSAGKI